MLAPQHTCGVRRPQRLPAAALSPARAANSLCAPRAAPRTPPSRQPPNADPPPLPHRAGTCCRFPILTQSRTTGQTAPTPPSSSPATSKRLRQVRTRTRAQGAWRRAPGRQRCASEAKRARHAAARKGLDLKTPSMPRTPLPVSISKFPLADLGLQQLEGETRARAAAIRPSLGVAWLRTRALARHNPTPVIVPARQTRTQAWRTAAWAG